MNELLIVLYRTDDGLQAQVIKDWDRWIRDRTQDVRPECLPKFVSSVEELDADHGEQMAYCLIRGTIVLPRPVQIVTQYVLP